MSREKFDLLCDFNICEEEKEKELGDYKAILYYKLKLTNKEPKENNWHYSEQIEKEFLKIIELRKEEFEDSKKYDYSIEIIVEYQITDKTSGHNSGHMEHHVNKISKDLTDFRKNLKNSCEQLNSIFREKIVIMYTYKIYGIILYCNFHVK